MFEIETEKDDDEIVVWRDIVLPLLGLGLVLAVLFGLAALLGREMGRDFRQPNNTFAVYAPASTCCPVYCHHYKRDGDTWQLYGVNDNLLAEVVIRDGQSVRIERQHD